MSDCFITGIQIKLYLLYSSRAKLNFKKHAICVKEASFKNERFQGLQSLGLHHSFTLNPLGGMKFTAPQYPQLNWELLRLQALPIVCNSKNVQILFRPLLCIVL